MGKLLSANYARLWKNKTFWLGVTFMLSLSVYVMLEGALSAPAQDSFDMLAFGYSQIIGFCCAVFTSLFLGTEYADGAIRNKIVVGHSRAGIYLANLMTVFTAMLLMIAAWLIGALTGFPFFGLFKNLSGCMVNLIASIFTTAAFSAIFTLVAMLCTNKAVSAVVSILLFMGLSVYAGNVSTDLIRSFLPTGRAVWIFGNDVDHSVFALLGSVLLTLLGSVIIVIAVTGVGIALFQKKDLK